MPDPIVERGADILKKAAADVPKKMFGTKELNDIIARMSASCRATEHGVAIAAPQIGILYRMFVVRGFVMKDMKREDEGADGEPDVPFINPALLKVSRKKELLEEACLSVPGYFGKVKRALQATVRASDENGTHFERGGSGLLAQIFQHETDHLNGILYVDKAEEVHKAEREEMEAHYEAREKHKNGKK